MDALTSENSYLKTFYAVISMKNLSQKNLLNFGLNSRYNAFTDRLKHITINRR